jgi:hypothetical protein
VTRNRQRAADRVGKLELTATLHVRERFEGHGRVYDGDRLLSEVDYSLKDVEEELDTLPMGSDTPVPVMGKRNIFGYVRVPPSWEEVLVPYVGSRLMLRLEDGRRLPFTVAKVMRMNRFLIQALGEFRSD